MAASRMGSISHLENVRKDASAGRLNRSCAACLANRPWDARARVVGCARVKTDGAPGAAASAASGAPQGGSKNGGRSPAPVSPAANDPRRTGVGYYQRAHRRFVADEADHGLHIAEDWPAPVEV